MNRFGLDDHTAAADVLRPISTEEPRGWRLWIQDHIDDPLREVEPAALVAAHAGIGLSVAYGMGHAPERFDRFVIRERGGGGVVVVPFALVDDHPYVGVIRQFRALSGRSGPSLPMGGIRAGESRLDAARREFAEEAGLVVPASALVALPGRPLNPSPGFFRTDARAGEGATFYAVPISPRELRRLGSARLPTRRVFVVEPPDGSEVPSVQADEHEAIGSRGLRFYHADLLMRGAADGFTLVGIGRLLSALVFGCLRDQGVDRGPYGDAGHAPDAGPLTRRIVSAHSRHEN